MELSVLSTMLLVHMLLLLYRWRLLRMAAVSGAPKKKARVKAKASAAADAPADAPAEAPADGF